MPRPRKPTELKIMEGTINTTREKRNPPKDLTVSKIDGVIFPDGTTVSCPKSITSKYCRKYWKTLTTNLINLHQIGAGDLPEIEHMINVLEKLRDVDAQMASMDVMDENFDSLLNKQYRLFNQWEKLSGKYFVSPVARQKIVLDDLVIEKTKQDLTLKEDAVSNLLAQRRGRTN